MKINPIRCICFYQKEYKSKWDNYYSAIKGMPIIMPEKIYTIRGKAKQYWHIGCPVCGRGGLNISQFITPYQAIKNWNSTMRSCYYQHSKLLKEEEKEINTVDEYFEEKERIKITID